MNWIFPQRSYIIIMPTKLQILISCTILNIHCKCQRGLISILNLGKQNVFIYMGKLIWNFFEILSKSKKLGGATAHLAPPLTRPLMPTDLRLFKIITRKYYVHCVIIDRFVTLIRLNVVLVWYDKCIKTFI